MRRIGEDIVLQSFANFSFCMSVMSTFFLYLDVIVGITKDDKWYSAIYS